jgi:tRNA-dihydrouridine synthase B
MGCPAKKVCNKWAGGALMQDEALALAIVEAVVAACAPQGVPVTLKMRTGWCAVERVACPRRRGAGVQMLTVHGRTREQGYKGAAEYDTIAAVKAAVRTSGGGQRRHRLARQGARGAGRHRRRRADDRPRRAGRPWIFREIAHFLATGATWRRRWCRGAPLLEHLQDHYACTARTPACAARASTSAGTCAAARRRGLPPAHEPDRQRRRAAAGRGGLL